MAVPARAALAGNPSDLYGGAVLAVPLTAFTARAEVVEPRAGADPCGAGERRLVDAVLARVAPGEAIDLRVTTDIPRSVGLAGSSAIVLAALDALAGRVPLPADAVGLAQLALSIERDDLGIPAGLQDRVVQAVGAPVLVDVGGAAPDVSVLRPGAPFRIAVAWCAAAGGESGAYHRALRAQLSAADAAMGELGALARSAAQAFTAGDAVELRRLMAESARLRARAAPLPAAHIRLAEAVTRAGLAPNSTGSGGAVCAVVTDDDQLARLPSELDPIAGRFVVATFS